MRTIPRFALLIWTLTLTGGQETPVSLQPRQSKAWNAESPRGYCLVRVRVDEEANVFLQGDTLTLELVKGKPPVDEGSECTQWMPKGAELASFEFKGVSGRGLVQLVDQPSEDNSYKAWVRVKDSKGRGEVYSFRLSWERKPPAN